MAGMFNPNFNPAQVMMGNNTGTGNMWGGNPPKAPIGGPYMPTRPKPPVKGGPEKPVQPGRPNQPVLTGGPARPVNPPQGGTVGPEAVRATGSGPYDNAYRQDLATYAGGQFQKPGGFLGLNPTGPMAGNPTGGGNAPVQGMPNDLLSMALGGQGFSFSPPTAPNQSAQPQQQWQQWLQNIMGNQSFGGRRMNG